MLGFGLWWLSRAEKKARVRGDGYLVSGSADRAVPPLDIAQDLVVRERATAAGSFDPAEIATAPEVVSSSFHFAGYFASRYCYRGQSLHVAIQFARS